MNLSVIAKISPLYDFWISEQTDEDEQKRVLKANLDSKAVYLFKEEPYKWENLFQSISREIIKGDIDSIRGMKILLSTISDDEKEKTIDAFHREGIFQQSIIEELREESFQKPSKNQNLLRFIRILIVIFTNPYGIILRREKKHLYERTGTFFSYIRKGLIGALWKN